MQVVISHTAGRCVENYLVLSLSCKTFGEENLHIFGATKCSDMKKNSQFFVLFDELHNHDTILNAP